MGQILISDVDDRVIAALESRAAAHGHALEDELRTMLIQAARPPRAAMANELRDPCPDSSGTPPVGRGPGVRRPGFSMVVLIMRPRAGERKEMALLGA